MKLKEWDASKSSKVLVANSTLRWLKMKSLLMFSQQRLLMLKNQRQDLDLILMIYLWSTKESTLQLLSQKNVPKTLTRFLVNGNLRLEMFKLKLPHLRMKDATTALSYSA